MQFMINIEHFFNTCTIFSHLYNKNYKQIRSVKLTFCNLLKKTKKTKLEQDA